MSSKLKQQIAALCFVIAAAAIAWWVATGATLWTTTAKLIQEKDELFGTVTEHWEKHFTPGLEMLGPVAGVALVAGIWLLISARRKKSDIVSSNTYKSAPVRSNAVAER